MSMRWRIRYNIVTSGGINIIASTSMMSLTFILGVALYVRAS